VAGAAKGNVPLLIFGLVVSIPLVAAGSKIVLRLIERHPVVVTFGGALLGWIAGELVATDPGIGATMAKLPSWSGHAFAAAGALFVVVAARVLARRHRAGGA
jgi:predicted tellurium resistance membrane protein TerC